MLHLRLRTRKVPAASLALAALLGCEAAPSEVTDTPVPEPGAAAQHAGAAHAHDHCLYGEVADPRDATLPGGPDVWRGPSGEVDLLLPQGVLAWMGERAWEPAHDAWHNVRRCVTDRVGLVRAVECDLPELVSPYRECGGPINGLEFLAAHRHMLEALRAAFPRNADLFEGFAHFPFEATDVPEEWRSRFGTGWAENIKETARMLEDIENNLERFPTEGDLAHFIQCNGIGGGIHGALHFKWIVNGSPGNLGNQSINVRNYMFWRLHAWLDNIWERYRVARKLTAADPAYQKVMLEQCREMDTLIRYKQSLAPAPAQPQEPRPVESGTFHEKVRPILEKHCSACHSETSPEAALTLGGNVSSTDVVKNLVNVVAVHGGTYKRVAPGAPEQSWLWLKASGGSTTATCAAPLCNLQVMPPAGEVTLSQDELHTIRQWIAEGAPAPTTRTP